jgi:4-amino-4-deoxy-L-arabinose transferase-like glycosyltransferase
MQQMKKHSDLLIGLALFVAALLPRGLSLGAFATADEAKWVYRSAQFLAALLQGDLAGTIVNLTPAVTTTWLGSIGLVVFHALGSTGADVPLTDWLASLPEFRAELDVLVAVRWPMVLFGSCGVAALYLLARRLTDQRSALVFGMLLVADPYLISLSRILGHDAPAGVFAGLSLLACLIAWQNGHRASHWGWMALSGALAGLAMLSKSPAFFLVPFVAVGTLIVSFAGRGASRFLDTQCTNRRFLRQWAGLVIWLVAAWLAFVALWPAAWQQPLGTPYAVVHNAFLSATDVVEAETEGYWQVANLGNLYYPVNAAFKLAPLAMLGLIAWLWSVLIGRRRWNAVEPPASYVPAEVEAGRWSEWALLAFVILFTAFMTLGGKRSNRYLLPAWPALYLLAGMGLGRLAAFLTTLPVARVARTAIRVLLLALLVLPAAVTYPYYLTYYNPLVGGPLTAPHLIKIGWGEGLDQVGRWLQAQPDSVAVRVGSNYASALSPFYGGRISGVTASQLDYVVLYVKQTQEGDPSPAFLRYFEAAEPLQSVWLTGIEFARVYAGPTMQPAMANEAAFDIGILPKPLFFRPDRPFLPIGETIAVQVLWLTGERLTDGPSRLTLQPATDLTERPEERSDRVWAASEAKMERRTDGLVVSRHTISVPPELPRGSHGLFVDGRPLGTIEARLLRPPPLDVRLDANFGDQIRLLGAIADPNLGKDSTLELVWQAAPRAWADYTVFLHLLDAKDQRIAGADVQPPEPTSTWARGEVVPVTFRPGGQSALPIPPDLPAGAYRLAVGLYHPTTGERLPVFDASGAPLGDRLVLPLSVPGSSRP